VVRDFQNKFNPPKNIFIIAGVNEEGLISNGNFAFYILTEEHNEKFYNANKVSPFSRERLRESSIKYLRKFNPHKNIFY
jgi:hypothetical protein